MVENISVNIEKAFNIGERSPGGPAWIKATAEVPLTITVPLGESGRYSVLTSLSLIYSGFYKEAWPGTAANERINKKVYHTTSSLVFTIWDAEEPIFAIPLGEGTYTEIWLSWWIVVAQEYIGLYELDPSGFQDETFELAPTVSSYDYLDTGSFYYCDEYYDGPLQPGRSNSSVCKTAAEVSAAFFDSVSSSINKRRFHVASPSLEYISSLGFVTRPAYQQDASGNLVLREASDLLGNHNGNVLGIVDPSMFLDIASVS